MATCASSTMTRLAFRSQAYPSVPRQLRSFASVAITRCGRSLTGPASLVVHSLLIVRELSAPTFDQTKLQLWTACSQSSSVWAIQRTGPSGSPTDLIQRITASAATRVLPAPVGRDNIPRWGANRSSIANTLVARCSW